MAETALEAKRITLKPMTIVDPEDGREYTLEYNRRTVAKAESAGLDLNKLDSAPMTMLPLLFWGAFLMHHSYMRQEDTNRILYEGLGGLKAKEVEYLGRLYAEPFKTLISGEDEGAENPRKMAVKF